VERVKNTLTKIIHSIGMFAAIIAVLSVFVSQSFQEAKLSVLLIGVTVISIYAVFNILFNKNKMIKSSPDVGSGSCIFGFSMLALATVCIRVLAFMLLDVDIMGKHALIAYIYTLICSSFIYTTGRLSKNHKSGLVASVIYVFFCSFDVYPVLYNIKNGNPKVSLAFDYAGILIMLLSYILVLLAMRGKTSAKSTSLFLSGGIVMGAGLLFTKNVVVAAICVVLMIALTKAQYRYVGKDAMCSRLYKSYKGVLFFALGFIAAAVIAVFAGGFFGIQGLIPEWKIYLKDFGSVNDVFIHIDRITESMWGGIYFERNRFITYISMLFHIFGLLMCSVGCMSAAKSRHSKMLFTVLFPLFIALMGIIENGESTYICCVMPFVVIMAGNGVSESVNVVYVKNGGLAENELPEFIDVDEKDIERIEKKYVLPKGCVGVPVMPDDSDFSDDIEEDEDYEDFEDDFVTLQNPNKSEGVASGENLNELLDDLFGADETHDDFRVPASDDDTLPKDGVVIFKDVIK